MNGVNMMSAQIEWFCSMHWAAINGWVTILRYCSRLKGRSIFWIREVHSLTWPLKGHDAAVRMLVEMEQIVDKDIAGLTALQYAMMLPSYKFKNQEMAWSRTAFDQAMSNMYENRRKRKTMKKWCYSWTITSLSCQAAGIVGGMLVTQVKGAEKI